MSPGGFVPHGAEGIAILLWSLDPDDPARLATPFFHAAAAAALELPVELYFAARSVLLLADGVADTLRATPGASHTLAQHLVMARGLGVRFYGCSEAWATFGPSGAPLPRAFDGPGGSVQFMARTADLRWKSLVY